MLTRNNPGTADRSPARRVLLIDDDVSLRRVTEYTLQQAGYQVVTAADGAQGLALFREQAPEVVITDIQMPGVDGQQVLQEIKTDSPSTLVIVITAFGSVEKAVAAMKAGAFDYITKPFSRDEISLVVSRAFRLLGLERENRELRDQLQHQLDFDHMVGLSDIMQEVFALVRKVAPSDASVIITGESGTGKELVARALHHGSERRAGPFVAVNCAAIPSELLETELFGHVKGAFTGAVRDRIGKCEQAEGGTLFLDEIGDLPIDLQPKILRVLQEREVEPVGGRSRPIDVRLVTATNLDIEAAVADGRFREDLFYRLAVIPVELPPLRDRREDIPLLIQHFLDRYAGQERPRIDEECMAVLQAYRWPGNVRELENAIHRLCVLHQGALVTRQDLPERMHNELRSRASQVVVLPEEGYPLEQIEREVVLQALQRNQWNQTRAAAFLRIPRHILIYRMEKYGISK